MLEKMADFFAARVEMYDEHMLNDVPGCKNAYIKTAQLIPKNTQTILDLGCGTGLEIDEILRRLPDVRITGIDLCPQMLDKLRQKHPEKNLDLICGDYFKVSFAEKSFDCAVSFQTMHHFYPEDKAELYKKICRSLKDNGLYIECDYMVETQTEQDLYFAENLRLRKELNLDEKEYYHYDTPCSIENQKKLLEESGFRNVSLAFREENTTILVAKKLK